MRKKVILGGMLFLSVVFLATHCFAALADPRKPRKTGASIYKKRGAAQKPVPSAAAKPDPRMIDPSMNAENTTDSRYNRMPQTTKKPAR